MAEIDARTLKIVNLAKYGVGGERDSAIKILQGLCRKHGVDFDDVMQGDERLVWFDYKYRTQQERVIIIRTMFKINGNKDLDLRRHRSAKILLIQLTPALGIEITHAVSVYLAAYRAEVRKLADDAQMAFVIKHRLWADGAPSAELPTTPEALKRLRRQAELAETMDDVEIHKGIEANTNKPLER